MAAVTTIFVAIGGLVGVLARYGINRRTLHGGALLWSTVAINVTGSFLLGLLAAEQWFSRDVREGLGVGLLGGFTTFSTFSVQIVLGGQRRAARARPCTCSAGSRPRRRATRSGALCGSCLSSAP